MKKLMVLFVVCLFSIVWGSALVGCGGGSPSSSPTTTGGKPLDPQGNWMFTLTGANTNVLAGQLFELNPPVVTSVSNAFANPPDFPLTCGGSYSFNGQTSGTNNISLTLTQSQPISNLNISLTGTIADDQQHMSGTYVINTFGTDCPNSNPGTWTAQLLIPVTGNWSGTVSDNVSDLAVTASLTENVDQTSTKMGFVTGTITLLGSPCFPSSDTFTLGSSNDHIGTLLFITAADANGVTVDANGTVSPDGKTWNEFNGLGGLTIHGGVCDGKNFNLAGPITRQP